MPEDDPPMGIPEWVVTFGDMMSLLLTFFIMLVSMSEMKKDEQYQAMVEAIQRQFGYETAAATMIPGDQPSKNSRMTDMATTARSRRKDTMKGGDKTEAPVGENSRVTVVRPGVNLGVGTVIAFQHDQATLSEEQERQLDQIAGRFEGKPHLIAIAGHCSWEPLPPEAGHADLWELCYARSRAVMDYLIDNHDIDRRRIRLQVVGPAEPAEGSGGKAPAGADRVEVYLLDETIAPMGDVEIIER